MHATSPVVTLPGMDSLKLQKWQVQQMHDRLRPTLGYLSRMCQRMDRTSFPRNDELRRITMEAQAVMQHLVMHLHYLGCGMIGLNHFGPPVDFHKSYPIVEAKPDGG